MDTLDQGEGGNYRVSERAIRNLTSSSVWVIITSACGIFFGLFILYIAFKLMSLSGYGSRQASTIGGIYLIFGLIITALHIVGLNYGTSLSKLKIYTAEDFERASSRQNAYWIFAGIVYIVWTLLVLLALAGGGFNRMFF